MKYYHLLGSLVAGAALLGHASLAMACSVCVTGAANDPSAEAFNWSVLFLMAAPYFVAGSIVGWLVYTYRRPGSERERTADQEPRVHLAWNQKESGR